jgi:2',3'-cyclic-nucleotide 2'-phosphodiesterase (5'-nucleotidase family)
MKKIYLKLFIVLLFFACNTAKKAIPTPVLDPNDYVEANIVQLNDVYEIGTLEGGRRGGLARVATVVNEMRAKNPNTYMVMAGDFLNPSFLGTLNYEGKPIKGRQMVEVLNTMGLNYAIFGNHEFDLDYPDLQARMDESKFTWISSDCFHVVNGAPQKFYKMVNGTPKYFGFFEKIDVPNGIEDPFTIGLFSATIPLVKKDYIFYRDFYGEAMKGGNEVLSKFTDVNVGITHLEIMQDTTLAHGLFHTPLLIGGHDHENMKVKVNNVTITKADANAKSIYIHKFLMHKQTRKVTIDSKLMIIDDKIKEDSTVNFVVNKWKKIGEESMVKMGFNPTAIVATLKGKLNARESFIRNNQCEAGKYTTEAMLKASKNAKIAFFNSGSIRIDDFLSGNLTEMDVIRLMPYGGTLVEVKMKGSLLKKILETGEKNKGKGGYLQRSQNLENKNGIWLFNGKEIADNEVYQTITSKFLFEGKEKNIEFFTKDHPDVISSDFPNPEEKNDLRNDLRKVFIAYLRAL